MNAKKEKIIAIIPARGGSKSIKRKNVLKLKGKPLVAWPIDLAKSVKKIDRVIVSTDDDEIAAIAKKYGAEVPFKRPAKLADDKTPLLAVLRHAVRYLEDKEKYNADIIMFLLPTTPFFKKSRIEQALKLFETTSCNSVLGVIKDWGRFWKMNSHGKYQPFYPERRVNRQYYQPLLREDGALYINRYQVLMKMNKIVDENKVEFIYMAPDESIDIDWQSDLKQAKKRVKKI